MASSMLAVEVPASSLTEADVDKALKAALHSCVNNPDFAIICDFLQKFSKELGLDLPNFKLLLQWLTKTDEVSPQLRDMQIKLLRKTRKTVHEKCWESALCKFCFTYSAQDGWEIERFGYKNSSVKVKLRILRELLECQFEHNKKFRTKILTLSADSLRSKPIGRDRHGHAYWVTQDNDCNIRIYQEHLDEEIWQVVATNRDEFATLLRRLKGSEVVLPCKGIGIIDEDTTSSSSQIVSESVKNIPPINKVDNSSKDEQKVPKLSIKLVQGKSSIEKNNEKDLGKGEEELAAEEDAKLKKKSSNCSHSTESGEEEFEEIEEEYDDDSGGESESEDEISEKNKFKKYNTELKFNQIIKSKDENKKVKPLLISQNKVISNQNCTEFGNSGKKRAVDQDDSGTKKGNQLVRAQFTLESKRSKLANNYEDKKKLDRDEHEQCSDDDIEVEEEIDEEDIDSVAAEEDENEEKLFEDYDDEDEEEEEVGGEISDPIRHVVGEGSGKDCDVENFLYCIDYDTDTDNVPSMSDVIVEDICYIHGEGGGEECLVGNNKTDDDMKNMDEKSNSDGLKTAVDEKSIPQLEENKKNDEASLLLESTDCFKLTTSKISALNDDSLNDIKNESEDSKSKPIIYDQSIAETTKKVSDIDTEVNFKAEIRQINGEQKIKITSENNTDGEKESNENETHENPKDENVALTQVDNLNQQTNGSKMFALESLKKELRESKQKLIEKKLHQTSEGSNINLSSPTVYNRKRRLTDQVHATTTRQTSSESEIEPNSENEDFPKEKEVQIDENDLDIGGKRLKMRPKQANTDLRKKIEAQKAAASEETTSSSDCEEELRKRKKILLSKQASTPNLKSVEKIENLETRKDISKNYDKSRSSTLTQQPPLLKQTVSVKPTKNKPTLAEIIEKKLKKTPEQLQSNLISADVGNNMNEDSTAKKIFPFPNKSPITKPLKKNLLSQIRQVESDEDSVPRKRTNSQELNTAISSDANIYEITTKDSIGIIASKSDIKKQKNMPERQRKRRSSEEAQNDSPEEPEAKKEVAAIEEKVTSNYDKPAEVIKQDVKTEEHKDFEDQIESFTLASGRRSGRRCTAVPSYVDTLHSKRNRRTTKGSTKRESTGYQKTEAINEQSNNGDVVNKSNVDKPPGNKSTFITEKSDNKEIGTEKNTNLLEITKTDVSNPKSKSSTKTPAKGVRKQREVDTTNIIDVDSETPVRQSRRIAQQKIREEAERRKLEEIALRSMKQELKKKKKAEKQTDPTIVPPTEPSSESEDSDVEIKKKVQKKKCPGKNGNWSSGSEEQEEPEDEDEEPANYETDPGSPLFKSDHEFSPESDIEDGSQVVPIKRARTVRKEDADSEATARDEEEACQKCNKSDHPEWILLCDNCDKGYHCSCLSPVLFYIPEGNWYCPPCQQEQLIKALENQLKEFDNLIENKKRLEEHEKRMAQEEKARQEMEQETNKHKTKKDKRIGAERNMDSSAEHTDGDDDTITNSDDAIDNDSKIQACKNKNRNRLRNSIDNRNHRDRRSNATRSRRNQLKKLGTDSETDSQNSSQSTNVSKSDSSSSSTYSESDNEPIYKLRKRRQINVSYRLNEYDDLINSALKKEMDDAAGAGNLGRGKDISTIIEADKEEKARQKQIEDSNLVSNPKEEKNNENVNQTKIDSIKVELAKDKDEKNEAIKQEELDSDAEPIIRKLNIKTSQKKKSRKLTTLDISSEDDDGSDEDFKGSSFDDEEEEDTTISASNSDSSLEMYKRRGKFKKKRRKAARRAFRERRRVRRFLTDESDDEDVQRPKSKKKRKEDSDYTETDVDDDDISELSENIDSADLCDDTTTDESDGAWRPNKRKKTKKSAPLFAQKSPKSKSSHGKKIKKVEYSDDDVSDSEDDDDNEEVGSGKGMGKQPRSQPLKTSTNSAKTKGKGKEKHVAKTKKKKSSEDESGESDSEDSTRRTRGRRYAYIEDFDDDSSDGGIKPGVQRPDTPPEEREKFIKRQEEIKRMLAEKNAEGAKLVATPRLTPIKTDGEKDKRSPAKGGGDSLSTVPLSVIRQAKVLDIDYLQRRGENLEDLSTEVGEVDDDFDDADLPDDLPEDMDEDAIARMVEEEEDFDGGAARDLPAPDEVLRPSSTVKPTKTKEMEKPLLAVNAPAQLSQNSPQATPVTLSTLSSGLQEPVRKRFPMPTIHPPLLRHQFLMHDSVPNTHYIMQRHSGPHTSHLLQDALSAPLTQPMDRNYPPITSSGPHHSVINRMGHSIPLQATIPHSLSTTRPSQLPTTSINTKISQLDQSPQDKSTNPHNVSENKPRGRRKKITPLRDTLQKQQTAAAVTAATASSSALASTLVKNNDPASNVLLSSASKSGSTPKSTIQSSVITNMPPSSHSAVNRAVVPTMAPIRDPYIRTDGPRFYDTVGNRISQTSAQRHRGPPQIPTSLLPPHPANRTSYGPPPPLKGSSSGPPVSSSPNASGSIRNPLHHVTPPYLGMPPNARHASHINMYSRPPIFGNPNFGPRVNLRTPNIHPSDYSSGSRAYSAYGFYPPPPPLTTPGQRPGSGSVLRHSTQMPPVQPNLSHSSTSVIVSATSSKSSNAATVTSQPTTETTDINSISKSVIATRELPIKILPPRQSSPALVIETQKTDKLILPMAEPRKKLTTLEAFTASTAKKSPILLASESSGSRSPYNPPTSVNDESSAPGPSENTAIIEQPNIQEGQPSEFSGLVSYFSSQHDDYNT